VNRGIEIENFYICRFLYQREALYTSLLFSGLSLSSIHDVNRTKIQLRKPRCFVNAENRSGIESRTYNGDCAITGCMLVADT